MSLLRKDQFRNYKKFINTDNDFNDDDYDDNDDDVDEVLLKINNILRVSNYI